MTFKGCKVALINQHKAVFSEMVGFALGSLSLVHLSKQVSFT